MKTLRITAFALLSCLPLLGCGNSDNTTPADPATGSAKEPTTFIGKAVKDATDSARKELAKENFDISVTGYPKAEISPAGELLIDGKAVALNAEQKALLVEYRGHIVKVAEAGMGVGVEGADLAGKAMSEAIKGVFTGNTDQIEKNIDAEAEGIKASAQKLCVLLPPMKATQDKLAAALPAFKPYARMEQQDIDECMSDQNSSSADTAVKGETTGNAGQMNAAEEAEAAGTGQ